VREFNRTPHVATLPWVKHRPIVRRLLLDYSFPVFAFGTKTKIQDKFPRTKIKEMRECHVVARKIFNSLNFVTALIFFILCYIGWPKSLCAPDDYNTESQVHRDFLPLCICCFNPLRSDMMVLCLTLQHFQDILHLPVSFEITYPYCVILRHEITFQIFCIVLFIHSEYRFLFVVCSMWKAELMQVYDYIMLIRIILFVICILIQ
jgi:hypothetical protein